MEGRDDSAIHALLASDEHFSALRPLGGVEHRRRKPEETQPRETKVRQGSAQQANVDSFCFTNIVPQVDDFNQSGQQGVWGRLEDALYEEVEVDGLRVCVMAAPVFRDDDMVYRGVALPREFWKVLAYSRNNELAVRAFLLAQDLDPVHAIAALDERTGLVFPPVMHAAGVPAAALTGGTGRTPLAKAADIRW